MEIGTKTVQDARDRMSMACTGSMADAPSLEYLQHLRIGIQMWLDHVEKELKDGLTKQALAARAAEGR